MPVYNVHWIGSSDSTDFGRLKDAEAAIRASCGSSQVLDLEIRRYQSGQQAAMVASVAAGRPYRRMAKFFWYPHGRREN